MPPGYLLSATVIYFFTSFPFFVSSIFQFLCRQLTHTAGNTSRSVFACCQNSTLSLFFRFEAFSFFRKSPRFLPASAGRILPASFLSIHKPELRVPDCRPHASRTFFFQSILSLSLAITLSSGVSRPYLTSSILTNSQARTSRSGLPAITSDISYLLNIQKPATHIRLCRPALLQSPTLPQTPSAIFRCLRATSFPLHFAAAFHSSNIPFFLFFLSSTLFLFLFFFFLSSFPFFFFFFSLLFLGYTFFFLAFFYLLFSFLFPFYFFYHITLHVFYVHQPKGCKTERSSVSRSRSHDVQWTSVLRRPKRREDSLPLAWFRGSAPYSFLFFFMYSFIYIFFLSGRQADSGRGSGGCAYVKVYIKIT